MGFSAHRTACNNWGLLFCCSFVERLKIKLALLLIYSEIISAVISSTRRLLTQ